jgi:cell division protein FtsQ
VAEHPLVREVEVDRRLPGTLVVRVVEHAPVALVPTPTGFKAYDGRGVPLPIDLTKADVDAPIVPRADAGVLRLLATARTDAPGLYRRVSEVRRDGGAGFVIMIDSIPVRTLPDVTLQRLADLEWIETDLARRGVRAIELDLRYRDQVIARLSTP